MGYFAVGFDATAFRDPNHLAPDNPFIRNWRTICTGAGLEGLPPATYQLWVRGHFEPVEYAQIEASIGVGTRQERFAYVQALRAALVFLEWPWYHNDSPLADPAAITLVGTSALPNPDPDRIPEALWTCDPTISQLERAYQDAGFSFGGARRGLVACLPSWLSASEGRVRFQLRRPSSWPATPADG